MDLYNAAKVGNLERLQMLLLEHGAVMNQGYGSFNETILSVSCWKGHLVVVRYLVEGGADIEKADPDGWTPLHVASVYGCTEVVRYLLEQGADRDRRGNSGWTPLHFAARYNHLEVALLLMSYGSDLNAMTNLGQLPIDVARNDVIEQAIRDEPRRRMDHGHKRATEQDRHPDASTGSPAQQEEEEEEQGNKRRQDRGNGGREQGGMVAEEDEDSEPSDDDEEDDGRSGLLRGILANM